MTNLNTCKHTDTETMKIYHPDIIPISLVLVVLSVKIDSMQFCVLQHFVPWFYKSNNLAFE